TSCCSPPATRRKACRPLLKSASRSLRGAESPNQLLFATRDQKEGMQAFIEKRKPKFEGR
ncbi:enoyl-CoA hydratase/carnithine racemase, partial [Polaromonas sp. CG_9.5]|nr:enoyl-CoA hydratase/carnithine racemase [Polaromonas sp. CG_9.5]